MSAREPSSGTTPVEVEALLRSRFGEVKVVGTPLNLIFLTADTAFKMKRAVRFPFVDFSSACARRAAALREIALNRAGAPLIYRDVVALTREADGTLALAGAGEAVEWLVRMNRFDESQTLDRLIARGPLAQGLLVELGQVIAYQHMRAPIRDALPWIRDLELYLDQNRAAFRARPALFAPDRVQALDQAMRQGFARIEALLEERGRLGCVRLLHGDLHLRNIVLMNSHPVLFDALEFDDALATGDQLYDLAFLIMDILERGDRAAALRVLQSYLVAVSTHDSTDPALGRRVPLSGQFIAGLAALPFFIAMRAAIRAKVSAATAEVNDGAIRELAEADARGYFELAERQMEPATPCLIAIGGLSGTGKSRAAISLAPLVGRDPGAIVNHSDAMRKLLHGHSPLDHLPAEAYSLEATRRTYERLLFAARLLLASGYSVILDAVFARAEERAACEAIAQAAEVPFVGLWLEAPLDVRVARIDRRTNDISDADAAVARQQETYALNDLTWTRIDATGTPDETRARALAILADVGVVN